MKEYAMTDLFYSRVELESETEYYLQITHPAWNLVDG
jgi:hypothetical protein